MKGYNLNSKTVIRYGIAEWYGHNFTDLTPTQVREYAEADCALQNCPFRSGKCNKQGGVCSMRQYRKENDLAVAQTDALVTMCPSRFLDSNTVFTWVGQTILGVDNPVILKELPFLMTPDTAIQKTVGKIDVVLIHPESEPLSWCALEMQSVYFSGSAMSSEFKILKTWDKNGIPFPGANRRPDFRSSGPKRLMPQLQFKVPTISRWGKKTAVVIDHSFWDSLGNMDEVDSLSNCDIA